MDHGVTALEEAQAKHESAAAELHDCIKVERARHNQKLYAATGWAMGTETETASARASYRDQMMKLATADNSTVTEAFEMGQFIGDPVLMRAAAAVADRRGLSERSCISTR
jgi:hypothetical protein